MTVAQRAAAAWQARLEAALPEWLPEFLQRQRWFGGRGRALTSARLEDAAWLDADEPTTVGLITVDYAASDPERFCLLLAVRKAPGPLPLLGRLEDPEGGAVVEAGHDPESLRALLGGFDPPAEIQTVRGGVVRFGDGNPEDARAFHRTDLAATIRGLGVEQSNTAIAVGSTHLFKLFRKLEWGENPELEMLRFLTLRTGFRALPALRGSLTWKSASGAVATLGLLQDWIDSQGDGWSHVLARLREISSGTATAESLIRDAEVLGASTRALHDALASEGTDSAFAPEPVAAADVENWKESLRARAGRVRERLEAGLDELPEQTRIPARALVDALARPILAIRLPDLDGAGAFHMIRVHGDFHLGQTLKTEHGFVLIDFEGEPARPFEARRAKQCALKDVAGMLRSFEYALETVSLEAGAANSGRETPPLRDAFLRGYFGRTNAVATYLPAGRDARGAWLGFFELDKALYEVEYELSHRPDWVAIPIRGVLSMLHSVG